MRQFILIGVFILLGIVNLFAQHEADNWIFGAHAGLNFSSGNPVNISSSSIQMNTLEGCASISDASGKLLFYVGASNSNNNFLTIWVPYDNNGDGLHDVMQNGGNLIGHVSATQAAIIVPKPNDSNIYYVFTVDQQNASNYINRGLHYYTVDMSYNGGLGAVIGSEVTLLNKCAEKITAVKGESCDAIWVVALSSLSGNTTSYDTFHSFEITPAGVNPVSVTSDAGYTATDGRGYLKISPLGNKLAIAHQGHLSAFLYDFDDVTGMVSNPVSLKFPIFNETYGVEFSLESKRLYISTTDLLGNDSTTPNDGYLYQFDLESPNPENTAVLINQVKDNLYRTGLQLAPDGKIYRTMPNSYGNNGGSRYLSVINNPEGLGAACNYVANVIDLGIGIGHQGLPPFIQSIFVNTVDIIHDVSLNTNILNLCTGDTFTLYVDTTGLPATTTYQWSLNGVDIPETGNSIVIDESGSYQDGNYVVDIDFNDGSCPDRGSAIVNYFPYPVANSLSDWLVCDTNNDGFYTFDFSTLQTAILGSQNPNDYTITFHSSQSDADNNLNPLSVSYNNQVAYQAETIYVRLENKTATKCYDTTSFLIDVFDSPIANSLQDIIVCDDNLDGDDTNGIVSTDLSQQNNDLLGGQNASQYSISYHTSQAYADAGTNALPLNYTNSSSPYSQALFVRIENKDNSSCYDTTSFDLIVHQLPTITSASVVLDQCDDDTDGYTYFNLYEANELISSNYQYETFLFYPTQADALAQQNAISNPTDYVNATPTTSTVWAEVLNSDNCSRIKEITLRVVTTQISSAILIPLEQCDDFLVDNDDMNGIVSFDLSGAKSQIESQFTNQQDYIFTFYENMTDALAEQNPITNITDYRNENSPYHQYLTVRVDSKNSNGCVGLGEHIELIVDPTPQFEIVAPNYYCLNEGIETLYAITDGKNYDYAWTDAQGTTLGTNSTLDINQGGTYNLTLTLTTNSTSCPKTDSVNVLESQESLLTTSDLDYTNFQFNNSLTIPTGSQFGIGDYIYSLSPYGPFTDSNYFDNLLGGSYTLYIQDQNGCKIHKVPFYIMEYMRFFTPNNDGYNDTWNLLGAEMDPTAQIHIFDRYGKLLAIINPLGDGWDGTYNGQPLPSTDYWFTIELNDGQIYKGHFSLVRR